MKPDLTKPDLTSMTNSAMTFTQEVTERWRSRIAGSEACLACGDHLKTRFDAFCDQTRTQTFEVHPAAFLGYIRVNIVLFVLALIALYGRWVGIAAAFSSLSLVIMVFEFLLYWEFIDRFFPLKQGKNVVGFIEPSGPVTRQVIISAHHDSAHIFNFLAEDPTTYDKKVLSGIASLLVTVLVTWLLLILKLLGIQASLLYWVLTVALTGSAYWVYRLWFFYAAEGTPGAGDNMICTAIAMEVGKHFAQQKAAGNGLAQTRVVVASWDAEEAGLRGARAYIRQYKDELVQVPSYNFNLECMYDHRYLAFLTSDLNSFVPLSADMVTQCVAVAERLEIPVQTAPFPLLAGGTDAAEFAKAGIEATTLAAIDWVGKSKDRAYHTPRDTIEAVDKTAVSHSIALGIEYILEIDGKE